MKILPILEACTLLGRWGEAYPRLRGEWPWKDDFPNDVRDLMRTREESEEGHEGGQEMM